jgi:hypothetical protein
MITLKTPLVLNSLHQLDIHSDTLGSKIMGNYSLIGSSVTSEDLLHMTTQPPEVFLNIDNSGDIFSDGNLNIDNSFKLELVNQLFNRIMMYGTDNFTYQDEVFVASVLNKMGITHLEEFMTEFRENMQRNELLTSLVNKLFDINAINKKLVDIDILKKENNNILVDNINNKFESDLYIQNDIFKRLNTANNNNTIYDYNNLNAYNTAMPSIIDITNIEQADDISLTRLSMKLLDQSAPVTWEMYSAYEMGTMEVKELTKENITKRIVSAVLENILQKADYYFTQNHMMNNWKNFAPIIYKSSMDVIDRFRIYQTHFEPINQKDIDNYNIDMSRLVSDENRLADLILVTNEYDATPEYSQYLDKSRQDIIVSMLENQNIQKQINQSLKMFIRDKSNEIIDKSIYEPEKLEFINNTKESRNFYSQLRNEAFSNINLYKGLKPEPKENQDSSAKLMSVQIPEELLQDITNIVGGDDIEISTNENYVEDYITHLISQYSDIDNTESKTLATNAKFLEELNNHNIYMKQLLDNSKPQVEAKPRQIVVDRKKAFANALKALENPEEARREVLENGIAIKREMPAQIEQILSITDENTRQYYEKLIRDTYGVEYKGSSVNNVLNKNEKTIENNNEANISIEAGNLNKVNELIFENTDTNIKNIEEAINSIKNETDINTAVSRINNIISTINNNPLYDNLDTTEYITYLTGITQELEEFKINLHTQIDKAVNKKEGTETLAYDDITAANKSDKADNGNEIFSSELEAVINNITQKTQKFYENHVKNIAKADGKGSTYINNGDRNEINIYEPEANSILNINASINNVSAVNNINNDIKSIELVNKSGISQDIEEVLYHINDTTRNLYHKLLMTEDDGTKYYQVGENVYSQRDIVNEQSDISIQNVSRIIREINTEADIENAIFAVNKIHQKISQINNMQQEEVTNSTIDTTFKDTSNQYIEYKQVTDEYISYLDNVINELESTKVINRVITQNNELVEKYIHSEVSKLLKYTTQYQEKIFDSSEQPSAIKAESDLYHKDIENDRLADINDNINDIVKIERVNDAKNVIMTFAQENENVRLIHATKSELGQEFVEEVTQNIKRDTSLDITRIDQEEKSQVTISDITHLKQELIKQSEENITRIVNQNIQTQVHTISDMVYLELEKRLRNEQRRRGY